MAPALGLAQGVEERPVELGVIVREGSDHALARRRVGRVRDLRAAFREPLLLLELHPLPRRIPQHAVETADTAALKHLRKRQMPVKELVLPREPLDLPALRRRQGVRVGLQPPQRIGGDAQRRVHPRPLRLNERRAPRIRDQLPVPVLPRDHQTPEQHLLPPHLPQRVVRRFVDPPYP